MKSEKDNGQNLDEKPATCSIAEIKLNDRTIAETNVDDEKKLEEPQQLTSTIDEGEQVKMLVREKRNLTASLKEKKEQLRKLNMVKMYRKKNDLTQVDMLITKWRSAAQSAVGKLLSAAPGAEPKPTIPQFLQMMQIDPQLIHYNAESDDFC